MTRTVMHIDEAVKVAISRTPSIRRGTRRVAAEVRDVARASAPKDTGAGARSIRVYPTRNPRGLVGFKVGWDSDHFYMRFQETGTERLPARRFLERAARTVQARHR